MMETFEKKQTKWEGLWWHPEYNGFSSASINLAKLKAFKGNVRLYVRKNKYFNGGENGRPNYMFSIKDANSDIFKEVDVEEVEESEEDQKGRWEYNHIGYIPGGGLTEWYEYRCSECHEPIPEDKKDEYRFCPYCGTEMDI
jgi:formylmethanofuran dehydrogenase subunit E